MRVVAGRYRGRRLVCPAGEQVRPTLDRVKENLFNLLGPVDGSAVLDLFAGTGGLGIEALSRGAARAVFCDNGCESLRALGRNLERVDADFRIIRGDFERALGSLAGRERFDLIFLDPPYRAGLYEHCFEGIVSGGLLAPGGTVAVECETLPDYQKYFVLRKERKYGTVTLLLLCAKEEQA